jgi:hypothetical protein
VVYRVALMWVSLGEWNNRGESWYKIELNWFSIARELCWVFESSMWRFLIGLIRVDENWVQLVQWFDSRRMILNFNLIGKKWSFDWNWSSFKPASTLWNLHRRYEICGKTSSMIPNMQQRLKICRNAWKPAGTLSLMLQSSKSNETNKVKNLLFFW